MQIERQTFTGLSEAEWLDLRKDDITSTEVAALFGQSPYQTTFELYHVKRGAIASSFQMNDRVEAGQFLEPAIAAYAAHKFGLVLEPLKGHYARIPALRLGASFDYLVVGGEGVPEHLRQHLPFPLDCKNKDWLQFKREEWEAGDPGEIQTPFHIMLQMIQQELCGGYGASAVAVLVGGNDLRICWQEHAPGAAAKIVAAAEDFWAAIAEDREPSPDFARDGEILKRLFARPDPRLALPEEALLPAMAAVAREVEASDEIKAATARKDHARAEIMSLMREAEEARLPDGAKITWKATKTGSRTLRITAAKPEPAAIAAE
ncbi:MAG: YqaJ viral recombinase family protein [Amaricoccus sp.]